MDRQGLEDQAMSDPEHPLQKAIWSERHAVAAHCAAVLNLTLFIDGTTQDYGATTADVVSVGEQMKHHADAIMGCARRIDQLEMRLEPPDLTNQKAPE